MIVEVLVLLLHISYLEWLGFNSLLVSILSVLNLLSHLSLGSLIALLLSVHPVFLVLIIINFARDPWMAMLAGIGGGNGRAIASRFIGANRVLRLRHDYRRVLIIVFVSLMILCDSDLVLTTGVVRIVLVPIGVVLLLLLFVKNITGAGWRETRIVINLRAELSLRLY